MKAWIARWLVRGLLALSAGGLILTLHGILTDPLWQPLVAASSAEIRAQIDTELAAAATPDAVAARISARLDEVPRNWLALDALHDLALRRGIALPAALDARFQSLRDSDHGWIAEGESCAVCIVDVASCSLEQAMICAAPVQLSPVGDVIGVGSEAGHYLMGQDVDLVNLSLSLVGLGATAAVLVSGGTSESVQVGAGLIKMARGMGRLPRWLIVSAKDAALSGVDWERLARVRAPAELAGVVRAERFATLTDTAQDLNRMRKATDETTVLHFLKDIDNSVEAHRFADASEALGKDVVGDAEVLGKSRLLRATLKWSHTLTVFFVTLFGTLASIALAIGHGLSHVLFRGVRRRLKRTARQ